MSDGCPHCGKPTRIATTVRCHGMFDCHLFYDFHPSGPDDLIRMWKEQCSQPYPAVVGERSVDDLGKTRLCPVIVLDINGKELRRVGKMVHRVGDTEDIEAFRRELFADPDIPRLMKAGRTRR